MYEDIIIIIAQIEREARARVLQKIAARQLGEAWIGLDDRRADVRGDQDRRGLVALA